MAFATGELSITLEDILSKVTEFDILYYYFNITALPVVTSSPLRKDNKPSFGLYTRDGEKVYYIDFATKDKGGIFDMLMKYWGESYKGMLKHLWEDLPNFSSANGQFKSIKKKRNYQPLKSRDIELQCKIREWRDYDLEYWGSYGITLEWLKYAEVYPISHKIIISNGNKYVFGADKYAYAYVERKENKITIKIYQPFNSSYKWSNGHDKSVISLWTKVPEYGNKICICSSMKDALCLSANVKIPAIAIQGEGYSISNTAISELRRRYSHIYILLDNDEAGIIDGRKLSESTGFTNIVLPKFEGGKDISDLYRCLQDPSKFNSIILSLFKD